MVISYRPTLLPGSWQSQRRAGVKYFGGTHLRLPTAPTPIGKLCQHCGSPICEGDTGLLMRTDKRTDPSVRADAWHMLCLKDVLPLTGNRIEVDGHSICWLRADVTETRRAKAA